MLHSLMLVYVVENLYLVSETHTLYELKTIIALYEPVCIYCDPFTVFDIF